MAMAKKLPLLAPSIHTFEVNGTYTDCEAKRTVFIAIQKMVSAGKYYRIPYHDSSKKGYSYKRKDGGLTITLADYPDFRKRYITLSGVNLARIAGDPSRLSLTDLSPEGLVMQRCNHPLPHPERSSMRQISMCTLMHKGTRALSEQKMIRAKQNENLPESQEWS